MNSSKPVYFSQQDSISQTGKPYRCYQMLSTVWVVLRSQNTDCKWQVQLHLYVTGLEGSVSSAPHMQYLTALFHNFRPNVGRRLQKPVLHSKVRIQILPFAQHPKVADTIRAPQLQL